MSLLGTIHELIISIISNGTKCLHQDRIHSQITCNQFINWAPTFAGAQHSPLATWCVGMHTVLEKHYRPAQLTSVDTIRVGESQSVLITNEIRFQLDRIVKYMWDEMTYQLRHLTSRQPTYISLVENSPSRGMISHQAFHERFSGSVKWICTAVMWLVHKGDTANSDFVIEPQLRQFSANNLFHWVIRHGCKNTAVFKMDRMCCWKVYFDFIHISMYTANPQYTHFWGKQKKNNFAHF